MARPVLAAGRGTGPVRDGARKFLTQLREKFGDAVFTTSEAKLLPGLSGRTIDARIHELNGAGAVEQTDPPKGQVPAKWKLTGLNPDAGDGVLPTVKQVMEAISRCEHADKRETHNK